MLCFVRTVCRQFYALRMYVDRHAAGMYNWVVVENPESLEDDTAAGIRHLRVAVRRRLVETHRLFKDIRLVTQEARARGRGDGREVRVEVQGMRDAVGILPLNAIRSPTTATAIRQFTVDTFSSGSPAINVHSTCVVRTSAFFSFVFPNGGRPMMCEYALELEGQSTGVVVNVCHTVGVAFSVPAEHRTTFWRVAVRYGITNAG